MSVRGQWLRWKRPQLLLMRRLQAAIESPSSVGVNRSGGYTALGLGLAEGWREECMAAEAMNGRPRPLAHSLTRCDRSVLGRLSWTWKSRPSGPHHFDIRWNGMPSDGECVGRGAFDRIESTRSRHEVDHQCTLSVNQRLSERRLRAGVVARLQTDSVQLLSQPNCVCEISNDTTIISP